jgi:hypothetical protein
VNDNDKTYTVSIARHNEADRSQQFRLIKHSSVLHDETIDLKIDEQGLLTSDLAIVSESKSADILYNITSATLNIAKIYAQMSGLGPAAKTAAEEVPALTKLQSFKVSFDPFIRHEVAQAEKQVREAGFELRVEPAGLGYGGKDTVCYGQAHLGAGASDGVLYRPLTTVKLAVICTTDAQLALYQNVPIPDLQSVAVYRLNRGAFTTKETTLSFAAGEPRGMHDKTPSEAVGLTAIPVKITADMLDALPSIGSLFYKPAPDPNAKIEKQTARLNAETAAINAHTEALKAKKAAEDAAASPGSDSGNGTTASMAVDSAMAAAAAVRSANLADRVDAKAAEMECSTNAAILQKRLERIEERLDEIQGKPKSGAPNERKPEGEDKPKGD